MKPIREVVTNKNGDEEVRFHPSARMLLFAMKKAENQAESDTEVARIAGIDPQLPNRWASKYGTLYLEWLEEFVDSTPMGNEAALLERVGMIQALQSNNYSFWKDLAKKYGVIKEEVGNLSITLNTDFTAVLVEGSPERARERILREVMGVGSSNVKEIQASSPSGEIVLVTPHEKSKG